MDAAVNNPSNRPGKPCGFRMSGLDVLVLLIVAAFIRRDYHGMLWRLAPRPRALHPAADYVEGM